MLCTHPRSFCASLILIVAAACQDSPVAPAPDVQRAVSVAEPEPPSGVIATAVSDTQVDVSWTDESGSETRFRMQRRGYDGTWSTWTRLATFPENTTSHSDTDVVAGTRYIYRIQSCNSAGCSAWIKSNRVVAETVPAAPRNLSVRTLTSTTGDITFEDMSDNETRFVLMRRSRAEDEPWYPWTTIATLPANTTTHRDSNMSPHGYYEYRVRACNSAGCSVWATH